MAVRASLKVDGLPEAIKRVDSIGVRARKPWPVLRSAATRKDLYASEQRRFSTGRGWKRLTPRWVDYKRAHGLSTRRLVATGALEQTLTHGGDALRFTTTGGALIFGIKVRSHLFYAVPLARGAGKLPARRMVVIDKPARTSIAMRLQRFIAGEKP
jgi:hypothetical protein